ncbi:MAG TPA: molybdenum cofactor guanylyltransferase [Longimicrobiales bacterium]|nr:molybdenum cofactor guanylyltransferase [Longimicrobiales bacterium]
MLAGGESRRFGRDKAAEIVAGTSLLSRAVATLSEVFEHVVVVSSRARAVPAWFVLTDLRPGLGPLAGLETALEHAARHGLDGAFVLACDLPLVDARIVREVRDSMGLADAAAPLRVGTPPVEPLCAAYRTSCLPAVRSALDDGELAVHRLFAQVAGVAVQVGEGRLVNVNRPSDIDRAVEGLRHRRR